MEIFEYWEIIFVELNFVLINVLNNKFFFEDEVILLFFNDSLISVSDSEEVFISNSEVSDSRN